MDDLGKCRPAVRLLTPPMLERLMVIQGYLHADSSSTIGATLGRTGALSAVGRPNPISSEVARRVVRKLTRHAPALGGAPLEPLLRVGKPGAGAHIGAVFPMRANPGPLECDSLGRPHGLERVHVVDASSLTTLAAPTITFTAMANAHRIASAL